ncbi:MAG: TolC family outer membrane protein [Gammaproteobacteria bacterium]
MPAPAETVQQAVRQALATNPQMQASISERYARAQQLRQARAGYYPDVNVYGDWGWENSDNPFTQAEGNNGYVGLTRKEASISLRENLFNGRTTTNEVARERARVNAAAYQVQQQAESVALQSVEAYLDVRRQRELLSLSQQFLKTHEEIYQRIRRRVASGLSNQGDLAQASGRLALANSNVVAAEANLRDAVNRYRSVVGGSPDEALELPALGPDALPNSLDEAVQLTVSGNPDLKSAQAEVAAALAEQRARRGNFYPNIDFVASQDWGENLYGLKGVDKGYRAMLNLRYNLFNGGADDAAARAQAYRANAARDHSDNVYREIVRITRVDWQGYQAASSQLDDLRQHRDAAARTRDAYVSQFRLGRRSLLDMLNGENELFEASRDYINGQYRRLVNGYRLLADNGQLLASIGQPMPGAAACADGASCFGPAYANQAQALVLAQERGREFRASQYRVGSFVLHPELAMTEMYDDNIYATPDNTTSDTATLIRANVDLKSDWSRHMLNFGAGGIATRYGTYDSENTGDYWGEANGRFDFTNSFNVFGGVTRSHLHEDRTSPDYTYLVNIPVSPIVYDQTRSNLGANWKFGNASLRVAGSLTELDFKSVATTTGGVINNDDRDRDVAGYGARLTLNTGGRYQPFVQGTYDQRHYVNRPDDYGYDRNSSGYRAVAGMNVRQGALHGSLYLGGLSQKFDDSRFKDVNDLDYGMRMSWKPRGGSAFTLAVRRSLEETILPGSSSYLYTRISGSADIRVAPAWTLKVDGSNGLGEYQDIVRTDKVNSFGLGVNYAFDRHMSLEGGVQHIQRTSDEPLDNYQINRVLARISAKL